MNNDAVRMRSVMGRTHAAMHRAVFEDPRLSYEAVGIHGYIANQSHWVKDWVAIETDIVNRHTNGRYSVREAIRELIEYGYVNRVQERVGGRLVGWRLDFYECPEANKHYKLGPDGKRDKPYVIDNLDKPDTFMDGDDLTDRENRILDQVAALESDSVDQSDRGSNSNTLDLSSIEDQEVKGNKAHARETPPAGPSWDDLQRGRKGMPLRGGQKAAMQRKEIAANAGVTDFSIVTAVTEAVTKAFGNVAAVQVSDRVLRDMQDLAISLISEPFKIRTAAQAEALYMDWKLANPGKTAPYTTGVLLTYASRLVEEGRLKDGNVSGKPATAGNGSGKRAGSGRAGQSGDQSGIDWTARAKEREAQLVAGMSEVPEGDIDF